MSANAKMGSGEESLKVFRCCTGILRLILRAVCQQLRSEESRRKLENAVDTSPYAKTQFLRKAFAYDIDLCFTVNEVVCCCRICCARVCRT